MNEKLNLSNIYETKLKAYCDAIYFGGSRVDPVIMNPHDYDYICFAKPLCKHHLLKILMKEGYAIAGSKKDKKMSDKKYEDFSQIRVYPYTQITWFSYLDILMQKILGEDVCPKTDIITKHRLEFLKALREKAVLIASDVIKNKKRWYHILRGTYILINNSYEVSENQKQELNILHDLSEGWELISIKTLLLLNELLVEENLEQITV